MASNFGGFPNIGPPGQMGPPQIPWKLISLWGGGIGSVVGLLVLGAWLLSIFTDFLWFDNLGYGNVYQTILVQRIWLFFVGASLFAAIAGFNVWLTYRYGRGPQVIPIPAETLELLRPLTLVGVIFVLIVASLIFGGVAGSRWSTVLGFMYSTPFNVTDPQFNKDISFFVFTLPLHHLVQGWLLGTVIVSSLITVAMYFIHFSLRGAVFSMTIPVRVHISVLGALLLFIFGYGYWLNIYDQVFSTGGAVIGATYADVNAGIPALKILTFIVVAGGVLLLVNAFWLRGVRLMVGVAGLWLGSMIILVFLVPSTVQRFQVEPSELEKEREFIGRNIDATREAFGLDHIVESAYPISESPRITPEIVNANPEIINNLRLWDHRPFLDTLNQIQFIRLYYDFLDVDVDRYIIDGEYKQLMVSARELSPERLPEEAQRWVNRKLQFTHGFGVVAAPVTEFTDDGKPNFVLKDVPPVGAIPITRPEVYYGENSRDYVVVNSSVEEFSYPTETDIPVYARYGGKGGVLIHGFLRKLAYSWKFKDINLFISGEITEGSRIQYNRNIQERVREIAPFLVLDSDPYVVVVNGELQWIQDAYTVTDQYPYSTPFAGELGEFNYIRNSVKIVMDAYHGDLTFYIIDQDDPMAETYSKMFPSLFTPFDEIDERHPGLRAHIRYPEGLFETQAEQYLQYHMTDTTVFFNKEDQWSIPQETFFGAPQTMEPYYLIMGLPDQEGQEFVLLLPFTPADRPNMVSWLAARNDGEHYGQLVNFVFPRGKQLDGPLQVEARIDNDPEISQQFTLWGQVGSQVLRGNLLVVPIANTILYVEPVFLQADSLAFPELKQIIVADAGEVIMRPTLKEALKALTQSEKSAQVFNDPSQPGDAPPTDAEILRDTLGGASDAIDALDEALQQLRESLEQLNSLAEGGTQ
jgi:uncharacterized membrane protein (UPF0182 family)